MSLGFTYHKPGYFPVHTRLPLTRTVETGYIVTTVYPTFYKQIVIEISIPPHWGNCLFDVYRSESEVGPWVKLTNAPFSGNFYKDTKTQDFSKFTQGWYVVECKLPDGRRIQSLPITWENKRRKWVEIRAKEIERRETILLEKFTGVKSVHFRRRQFGMRCKQCWDPQTEKVTMDHCKSCIGTSFEGGFYPGFETLFQYEPQNNDISMEERGKIEVSKIQAWTISYPKIEEQDIIIRVPDWKVFVAQKTSATEMQTVDVRQIVDLVELAKESIEFQLAKQMMPDIYE